ncbi:unnamed protein product [Ascophyllum nodosum]
MGSPLRYALRSRPSVGEEEDDAPKSTSIAAAGPSSVDATVDGGDERKDKAGSDVSSDAGSDTGSGGGDETLAEGLTRIVGPWGFVAMAGVVAYVGTVYVFWKAFRSYFAWSEAWAITVADGLPGLSVLDLFGSMLTCQSYRRVARFPKHAVETLVACSLMQFGGTLLVGALVLGQTPSWMSSSTAWPALAVCWWLTFFSPWDLWHGRAMRHKGVVFIAALGRAFSASHAITSWGADKALTAHFEKARLSTGCAILCGTLAGCGGGILADLLNLEGDSWKLQRTPGALASPSFSVQRCFGASCLYYVLADPHGYLSPEAPFPLSWLGSWSVDHGGGPSAEAAAIVAVYVTANHLLDYFIPKYEDPLCVAFKWCLKLLGVTSMVNPAPINGVDMEVTDKEKAA